MQGGDAGSLTRGLRLAGRFLLRVPWPLAALLTGLWALLIWDLSSHSVRAPARPLPFWELCSNLAHAPLFGLLTIFSAALLLRERGGAWPRPRPARIALVLGFVLGYAVLDEWHQSRIPGRDPSALDALTDLVSAVLVLWIIYSLERRELGERQLLMRLGAGVLLCVASAALAMLP